MKKGRTFELYAQNSLCSSTSFFKLVICFSGMTLKFYFGAWFLTKS